jgi:hypothetical protein
MFDGLFAKNSPPGSYEDHPKHAQDGHQRLAGLELGISPSYGVIITTKFKLSFTAAKLSRYVVAWNCRIQ